LGTLNPFALLTQRAAQLAATIVAICLALALAVQTIRIEGLFWIEGLKARLAAATATIAKMEGASKQAGIAQAAVNRAPATIAAAIAKGSDHEAPAYYDRVGRAADAAAVRLQCPADRGGAGGADLPQPDPAQPGLHRPDSTAELVCRPAVEDRQLVAAAARAAEMHQQALDLIAAGVAVPAEAAAK
jgi:hypothetical protein